MIDFSATGSPQSAMVPTAEADASTRAAGLPRGAFATTRWTLIVEAARCDSPEATGAMEAITLHYWFPL